MEINIETTRGQKRSALTKPISIRFTEEELCELKSAAGGLSVSEYVRRQLFSVNRAEIAATQCHNDRLSPLNRQKLLVQILTQLGQRDAFSTLNDLLSALQSGLIDASPELMGSLNAVQAELSLLRSDLLKALGLRR
ncbi:hypothetical protein [Roseibium sp. TrichSKD4]|uniref:hypothetical protein n=1 Tax=Roseibium sp. TrichSKD4 TaxID=744980 RepID=UPI00058E4120|nr:hypothetical protein [Roseibium sp. TrichSKD4]